MAWKRENFFHPSLTRASFLSQPLRIKDKRLIYAHTYQRNSAIPVSVLGKRVAVFNGLAFMSFLVRDWMNNGEPPSKPKYYKLFDSVLVP